MPKVTDMNARRELLPIKVVLPDQGKERLIPAGGSEAKPFVTVDRAYRTRLQKEVAAVRQLVTTQAKDVGSAPMRVKLRTKAVAKSHRPTGLFSDSSCPIIGAGKLGELFVKVTPRGLTRLARNIEINDAKSIVKEISTVEVIEPITPLFRRKQLSPIEILKKSPRRKNGFVLQVRLFDFGQDDQKKHIEHFQAVCEKQNLAVDQKGYENASQVFAVRCKDVNDVEVVSNTLGVRSVKPMPSITTLRPQMLNARPVPSDLPTADQVEGDYPVVVVVDSGISDSVPQLASWIAGRKSDVAPEYRNHDHGTFVAGLICWPSRLNPTLTGIDDSPCGVFDLQVMPNYDPDKGDTEFITEQEFLVALKTALDQYANKYKVWNLSIGTTEVCSLDEFSTLAEQLDNLQEQYKVSFVISAGNYETPPLLSYPRTAAQLASGRVTSPADSVLGITVGSISHIDHPNGGLKKNEPSAFSRHGAGPNYIIKPDMVHYGGTCSKDLILRNGIRSINATGSAEDLGTSFATPLVSRTLAQIYHRINPTPSPVLARALMTHHARDPRTGQRVPDGQENFFGFGVPTNPPYCLECTPHSATLVFDDVLRHGYYLEWDDFPYPPSLRRNGRYFGDIWMTVAFSPSRGARWGTEYCESHIEAHFGVHRWVENRKKKTKTLMFKGLVPPEHKNPGELYESYQVENLRKWAPVRTYFGTMGPTGERGERWRLYVRLLTRHSGENGHPSKPQPFSLVLTIADPLKKASVYDEMVQLIQSRFEVANLAVRAAARIRTKS
jgi:serine protease AprX